MAPPSAKPKSDGGLGRTLQKRRAKQQAAEHEEALHTSALPSGMNSVTQENSLDEFLNTAQLAGQDFTAERNNAVTIVPTNTAKGRNPNLLSDEQARQLDRTHENLKGALQVPKRPIWRKSMTRDEVESQERVSFLEWRRTLAELTDLKNLLMTPFERNLSVWRQLWRTIERSQLVVQIVDARNPLCFRCKDLETYVDEHHRMYPELFSEDGTPPPKKKNLILLNKADLLTRHQRQQWANYFEDQQISFTFFSALDATALQEKMAKMGDEEGVVESPPVNESGESAQHAVHHEPDPRVRILPVEELEALFAREVPPASSDTDKTTIGLVGYPNVGKSSTINALLGSKKVSVSSTPGKTKNLQTIILPESNIVLCDCPGLVFPQFANTKAELLLDGVLPIDQMREHTGPVDLLCMRIPKEILEATYGFNVPVLPESEGGTGIPTSRDLLVNYAIARGYFTKGQGNADEARSARPVLKDFVSGRLLFVHPPPGQDPDEFNAENRSLEHLAKMDKLKLKRAPQTRVSKSALTYVPSASDVKSHALEDDFFEQMDENNAKASKPEFTTSNLMGPASAPRTMMAPHQRRIGNDGRPIDPNSVEAMQQNMIAAPNGKKHHKGGKRTKQRSGAGY